jgi:4-amino-4-deoxy-L-arabinose transferase-like glycosyltransferase
MTRSVSACAWGALAATAAFIAVTCWWLTQDRSVPIYDAGSHLNTALKYHDLLAAGHLLTPFTQPSIYPILGGIVGALAAFAGGVDVAAPIVGENLVFVPLLALGCYQTGRLLFGPPAGLLAVVFVLGSPLIISLFHVFMLDAPTTALVAVSIWLILASEDFRRTRVSGCAGLAVGLGLNMKAQFPLYVVGLVAIVLLHGGWRNRRGFASFCAVAFVVGAPWYLVHAGELGKLLSLGGHSTDIAPADIPPTLSTANLLWYFWSVLNSQLLAPLFVLAAGGAVWTAIDLVRGGGDGRGMRLELLGGAFAAWLAVTLTPHHDVRYGLPLLAYLAILATGWIVRLAPRARAVAIAVLVLGVAANTLGITFGVGQEAKVALASNPAQPSEEIVVYSTDGFLASAPSRDGDVPGMLEALHREGVNTVDWSVGETGRPDFSEEGLKPLALIAKLSTVVTLSAAFDNEASFATLIHGDVTARSAPTCALLSDGTGVWVVRYDPAAHRRALFCATHRPRFYDIGVRVGSSRR